MMKWEQLTGGKVEFDTTLVSSTITYWFGKRLSDQVGDQVGDQVNATNIQQVTNDDADVGTDSDQAKTNGNKEEGQLGDAVSGIASGTADGMVCDTVSAPKSTPTSM